MSNFNDQIKTVLDALTKEKGEFALAMLLPSGEEPGASWNLVLSAPWIDQSSPTDASRTIAQKLSRFLSKDNVIALARFSILPTDHQFVRNLANAIRVTPIGEVSVERSVFGGVEIPRGVLFISDSAALAHSGRHPERVAR